MTWWADYNITYDESKDCSMDLSAWVSIINQSGASYDNARLKLIAGDGSLHMRYSARHWPAWPSRTACSARPTGSPPGRP